MSAGSAAPSAGTAAYPAAPGRPAVGVLAAGLLILHAVLAWYLSTPGITTANDDAVYLLLARSLRQWGYMDLFYVGAPAQSQYPPGYPAFLALMGAIAGERPALFVAANILLSVTGLWLVFDVVRRHDPLVALVGLAFLAIDPLLLDLAGALRSEPLYMALTAGSLWLLARPGPERRAERWAVAAAMGAALTRSVGVALIAGIGVYWLTQRRWRAVAGLGLAAGLTVGSWLAWTVMAPRQLPGRSYVADATYRPEVVPAGPEESPPPGGPEAGAPPAAEAGSAAPPPASPATAPGPFATLAQRLRDNIPGYARALLTTLGVPTLEGTRVDGVAWHLLLGAFAGLGLWGVVRWWGVAMAALAAQGFLLAAWPYRLPRYLAPLLPFILLAVFWGTRVAGRWLASRHSRLPPHAVTILLAAIMLAGALPRTVHQLEARSACRRVTDLPGNACHDPAERAFHEATAYIARETPDTARVLATKEGSFFYYTGRHVVPAYPVIAGQVPDLRAYLGAYGAEYIFLSHLKADEWVLVGPLYAMCRELELVRTWGDTSVLLRLPVAGEPVAHPACEAILAYNAAPWGNRITAPGGPS